ncbi:hypothetical protein FB567DRAFT_606973 [Paraphoma chrysanthemicola]|uniref:Uncharacterized protein n=1 Tax=Paraphoma chrysanthemicola TaxID=798071 RepID=A0A8K0R1N5_9PLEO|nr:hypothetical protein FB567DRAFT_606973 [Paraphoma chrysanthemicola]
MPKAIPIQKLDPDKICFFDLPPELRNMIYDLHVANCTCPAQRVSHHSYFEDDERDADSDDEMADGIMEEQADGDENGSEPSDEDIEPEHDETNEAEETGEERYDSGDDSWDTIQTAPAGTARWKPDLNRYTFAVAYSPYRDEIVIDYQGDLHGKLPRLSRASRQLLAETWQYTYDSDYKFMVYLHMYYARPLFKLVGVCRLLVDVCGLVITEANAILVI